MKKTIIILGQAGTGKTSLAKAIIGDRKFMQLESLENNYQKELTKNTEVIFIDECNKIDLQSVKKLISSRQLSFRKPYALQQTIIERPEIIITSNCLDEKDFEELPKKDIDIIYAKKKK